MSKNKEEASVVVGTKREELFTRVKEVSEKKIKEHEEDLEVQKEILKTAERIIVQERSK